MANQIVCVLAKPYGLRMYAIMLPPSDFSVAHSLSKKISNLYIFVEKYIAALKSIDVIHRMLLLNINIYSY